MSRPRTLSFCVVAVALALCLCQGDATPPSLSSHSSPGQMKSWKDRSKATHEQTSFPFWDLELWWPEAKEQLELVTARRKLRGGHGYYQGQGYGGRQGQQRHEFGPGSTPGFGGGPYCRYGQATSIAPYGLASSNRCGAFSASTFPYLNPLEYPGIGRRLQQYQGYQGGPGGGIQIVNSNPVSVSNPIDIYNPNVNKNTNFGGGGLLGLLG